MKSSFKDSMLYFLSLLVKNKEIKKKIRNANDLNQVVNQVLNSNQKTILLVIYNSQNQRRYIGVKLD